MKNLIYASIFFSLISPIKASITNELHEICKDANDYKGCIEVNKSIFSTKSKGEKTFRSMPEVRYEDFQKCIVSEFNKRFKRTDLAVENCQLNKDLKKDYLSREIDDRVVIREIYLSKFQSSKSKIPDSFVVFAESIDCKNFKEGLMPVLKGEIQNNLPVDVKKPFNKKGEYVTFWSDWKTDYIGEAPLNPFPVSKCPLKEGYTKVVDIQLDFNNSKKDSNILTFPMFAYSEKNKGTVEGNVKIRCENNTVSISPKILDLRQEFRHEGITRKATGTRYPDMYLTQFEDIIGKYCK